MIQISRELEEAARIHNASWPSTFRRIWLPLVKNGFVAGWVIQFTVSFSDLATVAFLYGAKSTVLPTLFLSQWSNGRLEEAAVAALMMTAVVLAVVRGAPARAGQRATTWHRRSERRVPRDWGPAARGEHMKGSGEPQGVVGLGTRRPRRAYDRKEARDAFERRQRAALSRRTWDADGRPAAPVLDSRPHVERTAGAPTARRCACGSSART